MEITNIYIDRIKNRYNDLIISGKELDNYDLAKIFEYYSCIQLSKQYKQLYYEYNDIDPTFKEENKMTRNDTGIDACNLIDTIVQCKLRKNTLTWEECGTFFGSQNIYDSVLKKAVVKWANLIITRNSECKLSKNLQEKHELYTDVTFSRDELITYCDNLLKNPPKIKLLKEEKFTLRDYQLEAIKVINNNKNVIISLPTGCGKNIIIIFSIKENKKYLILVPRIILMEQIKDELIKHKPKLKNHIQTIGDNNNKYDESINITICVYNSVSIIENFSIFDKIFIDEAHHINIPDIYQEDNLEDDKNDSDHQEDNLEDDKDDLDHQEDDLEDIDDAQDEIKNTTGFNKIIKSLSKYENNVYLSATIDEVANFTYYKKDIRDMIDQKYLCDYTIHIPIFSNDLTNKNICLYLLQNYRNIIIYCNSQKEGKKINELLNVLQKNCSEYIDCTTTRTKRKKIIKNYKKGKIPFLVNVRILVEGFDAPITKGICFIHLPSSKTTIIQIIGRALRLHPLKTFANIILPFSSKEDELCIDKFLKILAHNDKRIKKSYECRRIGGYISFDKITKNENENEEIEFRYEMIYDSMGVLTNRIDIWMEKLKWVKKYMDENKKRPSSHDKNIEINKYGKWICNQQTNYSNNEKIIVNKEITKLWNKFINDPIYKIYFMSNEDQWKLKLKWVKKYIDNHKKRPSSHDENIEIKKYGLWICDQQKNYSNNEFIMKNNEIRKLWEEFITNLIYKIYFISNEDEWKLNLKRIKKYIDNNKKRPSKRNKNIEIKKDGNWISDQQKNYSNNKKAMKNNEIRKLWEEFITNPIYKIYFISNEDEWKLNLERVKKYIDDNKKRPSKEDKNIEIKKDGNWISNQLRNYYKNKYIMTNREIRKLWEEFVSDSLYKIYFIK